MNWFTKPKTPMINTISAVTRRDTPEILEIDRQFNPWLANEKYLFDFLAQYNCGAIVGKRSGMVIGFALFQYRRTVLQLSVKVHHHYRRGGAARYIVDYLKDRLDNCRRPQLMALVAEWNLDAQLFFRAMGFEATGVFSGIHFDDDADRYCFRYRKES